MVVVVVVLSGLLCSSCNWISYKKASFIFLQSVIINKVNYTKIFESVSYKISVVYW